MPDEGGSTEAKHNKTIYDVNYLTKLSSKILCSRTDTAGGCVPGRDAVQSIDGTGSLRVQATRCDRVAFITSGRRPEGRRAASIDDRYLYGLVEKTRCDTHTIQHYTLQVGCFALCQNYNSVEFLLSLHAFFHSPRLLRSFRSPLTYSLPTSLAPWSDGITAITPKWMPSSAERSGSPPI